MDLSIVIPAFNEADKIAADIKAAAAFLAENDFDGEIIVVDDGSADDTTAVAKNAKVPSIPLNIICSGLHRGKGYAVRTGIGQTRGDYVLFADSGCCVPYRNSLLGLDLLKSRVCDIAHGSRKLNLSEIVVSQSPLRRMCARIFRCVVSLLMSVDPELTDTQCGFKMYRGEVARLLYEQCVTDGFMFDIEVVMRAQKLAYQIKEFPVQWTCDRDSRLSPTRSLWSVLRELMTIRRVVTKGGK